MKKRTRLLLVAAGVLAGGSAGAIGIAAVVEAQDDFGGPATPAQVAEVKIAVLDSRIPDSTQTRLAADFAEQIKPGTLRHAQSPSKDSVIWVGTGARKVSEVCALVTAGNGVAATCNDRDVMATWGAIPMVQTGEQEGTLRLTGIVENGFANAQLGGQVVKVIGNAFSLQLPSDAKSAVITVSGPGKSRTLNFTAFLPASG